MVEVADRPKQKFVELLNTHLLEYSSRWRSFRNKEATHADDKGHCAPYCLDILHVKEGRTFWFFPVKNETVVACIQPRAPRYGWKYKYCKNHLLDEGWEDIDIHVFDGSLLPRIVRFGEDYERASGRTVRIS